MDYKEILEYLFRQLPMFSRVGQAAYKPGLETSLRLDDFFGNPHKYFKSIHIAGTNGKGSTSHTLAAILQSQGYKTGLYTSPHLADFRERIRVNGEMISQEGVVDFVDRYLKSGYEGHPSFFELTMMMAFDWFRKENVDYAVIEVGMGGRLDSTNIITPILSVITNISLDHTQFLGNTLEAIAGEKAGIIKKGIPSVIGEMPDNLRNVFIAKAKEVGSELSEARWTPTMDTYEYGLKGNYQRYNMPVVNEAVHRLKEEGVEISEEAVRKGFADVCPLTGLMGRWMRVMENPVPVYCDTGHNEDGLRFVVPQIFEEMKKRGKKHLKIVAGFVADKALDHILPLLPKNAEYYFTNAQIPRALPSSQLKEMANKVGLIGNCYPDVATAYQSALAEAREEDFIFVGGSTFIVADLLAYMEKK